MSATKLSGELDALKRSVSGCREQEIKVKRELDAKKREAYKLYADLEHIHEAARNARIDAESALQNFIDKNQSHIPQMRHIHGTNTR